MEAFPKNRLSAKKLAGVLLLVTGLACLAFTLVNLARDLSLWVLGRHTTAEVVDLWIEMLSIFLPTRRTIGWTTRITSRSSPALICHW
jgi:hypothetical protein